MSHHSPRQEEEKYFYQQWQGVQEEAKEVTAFMSCLSPLSNFSLVHLPDIHCQVLLAYLKASMCGRLMLASSLGELLISKLSVVVDCCCF